MLEIFVMNCMTFTKVNTTKKINSLDAKNKKKLDYKKLRLSDNYLYSSEEEGKEEKQKPTKDNYKKLIKQIIDEETDKTMIKDDKDLVKCSCF